MNSLFAVFFGIFFRVSFSSLKCLAFSLASMGIFLWIPARPPPFLRPTESFFPFLLSGKLDGPLLDDRAKTISLPAGKFLSFPARKHFLESHGNAPGNGRRRASWFCFCKYRPSTPQSRAATMVFRSESLFFLFGGPFTFSSSSTTSLLFSASEFPRWIGSLPVTIQLVFFFLYQRRAPVSAAGSPPP